MSEEQPVRRRRSFTDEFKADAVAMVLVEGRRIVDVAEILTVGDGTLGNWVKQARIDRGEKEGLTTSERAELAELRKENARLRMGTRPTQTSDGLLGEGVGTVTRYRWVAAREAEGFPTIRACEAAGVSRQSFYEWKNKVSAGPTLAELDEARLVEKMRKIHDRDDTVGSPRMTVEQANQGWEVNHKRVERLMRVHGIVGIPKPVKVRTTIPAEDAPKIPDLVGRRFTPGRPDWAWCSDITYIPTGEGWLYLATVIDLGSRRLVGYSMASHMRASLVTAALEMAVGIRGGCCDGIIFHSDRGSQYTSAEMGQALDAANMLRSVGRTGVCWDNAVAEAFFGTLKRELESRTRFATRDEARRAIFAWINHYNHRRLHSSLDYQTPTQWEDQYGQSHGNEQAA